MAGRNTRWTWRTWSSARWSTRQTIRWSAGVLIRWSGDQVISKGSGDQVLSRTYAYWSGDQQNVLIRWSLVYTDQLISRCSGEKQMYWSADQLSGWWPDSNQGCSWCLAIELQRSFLSRVFVKQFSNYILHYCSVQYFLKNFSLCFKIFHSSP